MSKKMSSFCCRCLFEDQAGHQSTRLSSSADSEERSGQDGFIAKLLLRLHIPNE